MLGFPGVDPLHAAVGARLKRWREDRGLSIEDVAALIYMPVEEARRAEAGRAHFTTAQIGAATSALHLPLWRWCRIRGPLDQTRMVRTPY